MTKLKIHFVCRANVYRSRIAEGYFNKISGGKYSVSSSGVERWQYPSVFKDSWVRMIARRHGFENELSQKSHQTTTALLADKDMIVFVKQDVYDEALKLCDFDKSKTTIWHVRDRRDFPVLTRPKVRRETTWQEIKDSVDELYAKLEEGF